MTTNQTVQEQTNNTPQYLQNNINPDIVNVELALQQWTIYQELTQHLLDESDYQKIGDRKFKKKSAWRKYMRAFNISTTIQEKEIEKDKHGRVTNATFIIKAISPDGRYAEGWGNCSKFERKFNKPNHDIPSTAMTRATNRAVSDLIGAGEVSAEEITPEKKDTRKPPLSNKEIEQIAWKKM